MLMRTLFFWYTSEVFIYIFLVKWKTRSLPADAALNKGFDYTAEFFKYTVADKSIDAQYVWNVWNNITKTIKILILWIRLD